HVSIRVTNSSVCQCVVEITGAVFAVVEDNEGKTLLVEFDTGADKFTLDGVTGFGQAHGVEYDGGGVVFVTSVTVGGNHVLALPGAVWCGITDCSCLR